MTWTYEGTPGESTLDEMRFLLGDVDSRVPLVEDEVLLWLYDSKGSVVEAVIAAAESFVAKHSHQPVVNHAGGTVDYTLVITNMLALIERLRGRRIGLPVWTGDEDANPSPLFTRNMRG